MFNTNGGQRARIVITEWAGVTKNTLRGFFSMIDNETGVLLNECSLHFGENEWIGLPCAPQIYDGQVLKRAGKAQYKTLIKIVPRERWERFQQDTLAALQAHPEAGKCWSGGHHG